MGAISILESRRQITYKFKVISPVSWQIFASDNHKAAIF